MIKWLGLLCLISADWLLIRYAFDQKQKPVQCLWEMIGFFGGVTHRVTEWKQTLDKAIKEEADTAIFPKLFQKNYAVFRESLPVRESLENALKKLPLPNETIKIFFQYFAIIGKSTDKNTEERFQHTKSRLEEILIQLRQELPKAKKMTSASVCSISAMVAVLLL